MLWLEIFGTICAALGFSMLAFGFIQIGFIIGLVSCFLLIPLFWYKKLYYMLTLQSYFAIMNIIGITGI